jgi:hypothetical protein
MKEWNYNLSDLYSVKIMENGSTLEYFIYRSPIDDGHTYVGQGVANSLSSAKRKSISDLARFLLVNKKRSA